MSANLDLVRSIYADWERGELSSDEWPDAETEVVFADGPAPGSRLRVGATDSIRDWLSAGEDVRIWADAYREIDEERVLVLVYASGRGKTSGLEVGQLGTREATLFEITARPTLPGALFPTCK